MKRVLILGGGVLNVLSIQEARKNGFYTIVADGNTSAPGFAVADQPLHVNIADANAVIEAIKDLDVDGVVASAEVGVIPMARITEHYGLPGISVAAAENSTSKAKMRTAWQGQPFSVPYYIVTHEEDALKACHELKAPLIFKPDKTYGGSRGVLKVDRPEQFAESFRFARKNGLNDLVVIEKCTSGKEYSVEILVYKGKTSVLCIGENTKMPEPYRVNHSIHYPASFTEVQMRQITYMCHHAILGLGIEIGVGHLEFAMTESGPVVFEIGARCGGGHIPLIAKHVSGVNEFVEFCRMACGMAPEGFIPQRQLGAEYRFILLPPGKVKSITIPQSLHDHPGILDVVMSVKPGESVFPLESTSQRAGCIVTVADTQEEAQNLADWASTQIIVEYFDRAPAHPLLHPDEYDTA